MGKRLILLLVCLAIGAGAGRHGSDEVLENTMPRLEVEAGGQIFTATLLDNPSTRALLQQLPMTVSMDELNGNEKYYYMSNPLPVNAERPGNIHAGDLMLYGSDCLVLFYESFSSGYSYTRLGSIDDPTGLAAALGDGNVTVTFDGNGQGMSSAPVISKVTSLEPGFSSAEFSGDDGFSSFLAQGGADSDRKVASFLSERLNTDVAVNGAPFGCSAFLVKNPDGGATFGRNFDWYNCDALVLTAHPSNAYASISTVNLGFLQMVSGKLEGSAQVYAALYAPLDGMNEKGLAVSVNMIQDSGAFNQDNGKPDLTTTTAIRLLLNQAANVEEAISLLRQYDLHASFGMTVHFAIADNTGRCVAVEYINNQMVVTESPVVTNFYLAEGEKNGVGTQQSHTRYQTLLRALQASEVMDMDAVRDALQSVGKQNFHDGETTEWSAVFNLQTGEAQYCHREDFARHYDFSLT